MTMNLTGQEQEKNLGSWWTSLLSFGMKAVGTVVSQYLPMSTEINQGDTVKKSQSHLGPIDFTRTEIITSNTRSTVTKTAKNRENFPVMLSVASTSSNGSPLLKELILLPNEEKDVSTELDDNLTGTLSWAKFDKNSGISKRTTRDNISSRTMLSVKDWGPKNPIFMFNKGLKLSRNDANNFFALDVTEEGETYYDIEIMVVDGYGSVYDFGLFDVEYGTAFAVQYPDELDQILPIPRVTIWASCGKKKYEEMLRLAVK
ncbi:hypothetical protein U14_05008 [Candidatus Moduliflexus flocculans]|uniref:Uncharacterized protein n=1 Tax=Candidatus Moduliflexus flocculans TaxID=1499966 RepID=A0A081BQQ3_9BACT|nr:hypothetical protein U14_05008 [Candidatus Moduliflexus flocculans]